MDEPISDRVLAEILLGGPPAFTQVELSAKSGVSEELGQRIWQALGFPRPPADATLFTEQDLAALRDIRELLAEELVDEEMVITLARAIGQTMGRLASWLSDVWFKQAAELAPVPTADGDQAAVAATLERTRELLPRFERLLLQGWRRQLAASGLRLLTAATASIADPVAGTATVAVGFADIVSFTRLSREMDGDTLAAFVQRFEETATAIGAELDVRIVKTLGDEVLFTAADPRSAAEFALRMTERSELDEGFPRVRAGVAYGEVIQRLGDVFGTPVNLAARLTSTAHPGSVLVDEAIAEELQGQQEYEAVGLRPRPLQGLGRVRPWVLRRRTGSNDQRPQHVST